MVYILGGFGLIGMICILVDMITNKEKDNIYYDDNFYN